MGGGKNRKSKPQREIPLVEAWPELLDHSLDYILWNRTPLGRGWWKGRCVQIALLDTSLNITEHFTLFVQKFHRSWRYGHGSWKSRCSTCPVTVPDPCPDDRTDRTCKHPIFSNRVWHEYFLSPIFSKPLGSVPIPIFPFYFFCGSNYLTSFP